MHHVLERQLKHVFGSIYRHPAGLEEFLKVISETYDNFDEDRALLDRLLEQSSKEYRDNSKSLVGAKGDTDKLADEHAGNSQKEYARLLATVDSISVGLILLDNDNNIVISNKCAHEMLNKGDAALSLTLEDIEKALTSAIDVRKFSKELSEKKLSTEKTEIMLGQKPLHVTLSPVTLPEAPNDAVGMVILIEDNTESHVLKQNSP